MSSYIETLEPRAKKGHRIFNIYLVVFVISYSVTYISTLSTSDFDAISHIIFAVGFILTLIPCIAMHRGAFWGKIVVAFSLVIALIGSIIYLVAAIGIGDLEAIGINIVALMVNITFISKFWGQNEIHDFVEYQKLKGKYIGIDTDSTESIDAVKVRIANEERKQTLSTQTVTEEDAS